MDVYRKEIYDEYPDLAEGYRDAIAKVRQGFTDPRPKQDILTLLLLSRVLGNDFQPTDAFLAAALYDQDSPPAGLLRDLEDLSNAGLIWRRQAETPVWELEGGGGTQIGGLIEEEEAKLPTRSFAEMLINDAELREDLLPQCGIHDLDPSPAGIIRSLRVDLVEDLTTRKVVDLPHEGLSAQVFFALPANDLQASQQPRQIDELEAPGVPTYLWLPSRGLSDLLEDLRRYRAILNLVQRAALGDGPRRRLQNKADQVRAGLRAALNQRLGRQALRQRDVSIRRLDDPEETVTPQSWHGFVDHLDQQVRNACSKEVQVRAMNANRLYVPEGERRIRGIEKLLQNILDFDDLPASGRNDLFGEVETSELAALIDGTLGVYTNRLMIERASGWDLKTPDEADGPMGEVLRLIRDSLLDKRKKVHDIADLRGVLVRPPYGLPFSVMPIFAAVAIRKDYARLKWVNKQGTFSSLLWSAFTPNGDGFKLRFDTFPPKQREVLEALRGALRMREPGAAQDPDERAREAVKEVRAYYAELPKELKQSSKLPDETKRLFDLLKRPGQDDQEVAKLLCDLVQSADGPEQQRDQLREMLDAVDRIADERRAVVRQIVDGFSRDPEQWQRIRQTLLDQDNEALAVAIARVHANQADGLDRLAMRLLRKPFAECSDIEVGRLGGELEAILEAIVRPPAPPPPPPSPPGGGDPSTGRGSSGPDVTSAPEAPAAAFRRELTQLVAKYRTELSSDELREIVASITARQSEESMAEGAGG